MSRTARPWGHLQVVDRGGGRRWDSLWRDADGRHQRVLRPAWVKDSGKRTARGAVMWRAGNGPKPDPSYLTPAERRPAADHPRGRAAARRPEGYCESLAFASPHTGSRRRSSNPASS
jgi:hypothetical protein